MIYAFILHSSSVNILIQVNFHQNINAVNWADMRLVYQNENIQIRSCRFQFKIKTAHKDTIFTVCDLFIFCVLSLK